MSLPGVTDGDDVEAIRPVQVIIRCLHIGSVEDWDLEWNVELSRHLA